MEKELKIAELATIWNVSVPTTWNRIKKMGLTTFIKKNESNKDINYVSISDEQINEYIVNVNNNVNNANNNGFYEDMLSNNNVVNKDNEVIDVEFTRELPRLVPEIVSALNNVYNEQNQQIININNVCNERLETIYNDVKNVYEELAVHKANTKMLEDKKASEGLYLSEIKELKKEKENLNKDYNELKIEYYNVNNQKENALKDYENLNKKLNQEEKAKHKFKVIAISGLVLFGLVSIIAAIFITIFIMDNKPVNNVSEQVTSVQQPDHIQAPAATPPVKPVKKK